MGRSRYLRLERDCHRRGSGIPCLYAASDRRSLRRITHCRRVLSDRANETPLYGHRNDILITMDTHASQWCVRTGLCSCPRERHAQNRLRRRILDGRDSNGDGMRYLVPVCHRQASTLCHIVLFIVQPHPDILSAYALCGNSSVSTKAGRNKSRATHLPHRSLKYACTFVPRRYTRGLPDNMARYVR